MGTRAERSARHGPRSTDQRFLPRWHTEQRVLCEISESKEVCEAVCRDLTLNGSCVVSRKSLPLHQDVRLKIFLPEEKAPVLVKGRTVWKKRRSQGQLTGILFEKTSRRAQEILLKHAFTFPDLPLTPGS